jgi:hypothetical protein
MATMATVIINSISVKPPVLRSGLVIAVVKVFHIVRNVNLSHFIDTHTFFAIHWGGARVRKAASSSHD